MNANSSSDQVAMQVTSGPAAEFISTSSKDAPIAAYMNDLFREAARRGASDVHFDDQESDCLVRFRLRGELQEEGRLTLAIGREVDRKIRSRCRFSLIETQAPQDGKFEMSVDGRNVEFRVSILPLARGQSIVCRLLDKSENLTPLSKMEMPADIHAALQRVISQPQGMLMVTGPTGSGKTTTLYGVLLQLIKPAVKIITIEDPVEYRIEGLTQAQVNPKLAFAKALKAMLRQDPDVILVGEIRDDETAGIAAQSALTGHLVLTTLHTNSALMTLSRMLDLKVDPNVLAASMGGILAQRLVRRLCQHCRLAAPLTHEVAKLIEKSGVPAETISAHSSLYTHNPHGCEHCKSGWSGRKGIYELLLPTQAVRLAIEESSLKDLARAAETQPQYRTLLHDAMLNVLSGDTSLAEALDVTGREVL